MSGDERLRAALPVDPPSEPDLQSGPAISSNPAPDLKTPAPPAVICGFCGQVPEAHADSDAGPMSVCPATAPTPADPPAPEPEWEVFTAGDGERAIGMKEPAEPMTTTKADGTRWRLEPLLCTECDGTGATGAFECDHCLGNGMKNHPPLFRLVPIGGE